MTTDLPELSLGKQLILDCEYIDGTDINSPSGYSVGVWDRLFNTWNITQETEKAQQQFLTGRYLEIGERINSVYRLPTKQEIGGFIDTLVDGSRSDAEHKVKAARLLWRLIVDHQFPYVVLEMSITELLPLIDYAPTTGAVFKVMDEMRTKLQTTIAHLNAIPGRREQLKAERLLTPPTPTIGKDFDPDGVIPEPQLSTKSEPELPTLFGLGEEESD